MEQCNWKDVPLSQTRVPQGPGQNGDPAEGGGGGLQGFRVLLVTWRRRAGAACHRENCFADVAVDLRHVDQADVDGILILILVRGCLSTN
ncbi:unnamed protein product [Boreogadus saida]